MDFLPLYRSAEGAAPPKSLKFLRVANLELR
jgi:hypothetical protein